MTLTRTKSTKQDNDVDANKSTKGTAVVKMRDKKDNKWGSRELPCHRVQTRGPNFSHRVTLNDVNLMPKPYVA